jgi:tetratricopeptide (TPR) repeat protein
MVAHYFRNYKVAVARLRECLEITQLIMGEEHPYVVLIRCEIGSNLGALGELAAAEVEYRAALDVTRKTVGLVHPRAIVLVEQAGALLVRRGKRSEAEGLYEELLKARRKRFGSDDVFVAEGLQAYAAFLSRRGQPSRAEPLYREALDTFRKAEVRGGRRLEEAVAGLALLLRRRGGAAEAEKLLRDALDGKQVALTPKGRLALRQQLFEVLVEQNRFAAARNGLADLLTQHRAQKTAGQDLLNALAQAGRVYCELGEFAKAEPLFRDEAELRLNGKAGAPAVLAGSLRRLGLAQLAAGDADACRRTGSRLLERLAGTADAQAANLTVRLGTLTPAADKDQARLLDLASRTAKRSPSPASLAALGAALCRSGKYEEAAERLEEALRLDTGKRFPQARLFLALAYHRLNQPDKARAALQSAAAGAGGGVQPGLEWEGRLEHQLLLRQVQGLLKETATGG